MLELVGRVKHVERDDVSVRVPAEFREVAPICRFEAYSMLLGKSGCRIRRVRNRIEHMVSWSVAFKSHHHETSAQLVVGDNGIVDHASVQRQTTEECAQLLRRNRSAGSLVVDPDGIVHRFDDMVWPDCQVSIRRLKITRCRIQALDESQWSRWRIVARSRT